MGQIAGSNKGIAPINQTDLISIIIRYALIILLITITFLNMNSINIQFIMFITQLFLVIIAGTFIVKDIVSVPQFFNNKNPVGLFSVNKIYTNIFLFILLVCILAKITSITLFIIVFGYGKTQLNSDSDSTNTKLTSDNQITFNRFFITCVFSSILIVVLTALIFIGNTTFEVRSAIINMLSLFLALIILGFSGYEIYSGLNFYNVYKNNGIVYESK
jgi:hypothetical protein